MRLRWWPRQDDAPVEALELTEAMERELRAIGLTKKHRSRWVRTTPVVPAALEVETNEYEPRYTDISIYFGAPGDLGAVVFQTSQATQAGRPGGFFDAGRPDDRAAFEQAFHLTTSVLVFAEDPQRLCQAIWHGDVRPGLGSQADSPLDRLRDVLPIAQAYGLRDWEARVLAEGRRLRGTSTWGPEVEDWIRLGDVPI